MRVLLIYPVFPKSFWSFEKTLALVGKKALLPPLNLVTVAAILPHTWEFKLVDRNVRPVTDAEWDWAELILLSGMIVQKGDLHLQIQEAKQRGKPVAVGGPYATSLPDEVQAAGADYLVLDEGEITLPLFVAAIERGEPTGIFRTQDKPDVTTTPIPRYELLEFDAYDSMSVQFSRGCPFQCEFCDIITLYGRKPRTKEPSQILAELDYLYNLGWRSSIFMVDDNFIGNKRNVKRLLYALKDWIEAKRYPFFFITEASVDLAQDPELMALMVACNFAMVFLGIETPDVESLTSTKKFQNNQAPLIDSVEKITHAGLQVMAGFIIGFDGEQPGAGDRIVRFVEQTSIPVAIFSMLQALPNTALWNRLIKEGRLLNQGGDINQTTLMNFVPTRSVKEIAQEFVDGFWRLYEPSLYLDRTFRYYMKLNQPIHRHVPDKNVVSSPKKTDWKSLRGAGTLLWKYGIKGSTRGKFWRYLFQIYRTKPHLIKRYLSVFAYIEHFSDYRVIVQQQIQQQLAEYLAQTSDPKAKASMEKIVA